MDFELTDDQQGFRDTVRQFAERFLASGVTYRDEHEQFSRELFDQMANSGLTGICFPSDYGGSGLDVLSYILAIEEISRIDAGIGVTLSTSESLCAWPIFTYGTEEQKRRVLFPLLKGRKLGAFCLTEPEAGTDVGSLQTSAIRDDNHYILNGKKIFVTNAGEAETYVLFATVDKALGAKGISAFILEKGMPGLSFGKAVSKMGIRSSITGELILDHVRIPSENRIGRETDGYGIAMSTLNGGRIAVAAQAIGIAQAAFDHAVNYAKTRIQFGKPISSNQTIAFTLADMATQIDAARLLTYRAADLKSRGKPYCGEASMAKMFASDVAMSITTDAVQILGGNGYRRDYPVERLMRDAKITQIYEGTNQAQRMVISNAILQ